MRPATHCPSCNTPIGPQPTNFCPNCGYPLLAAAPPLIPSTSTARQARGTKQGGFYFPSQRLSPRASRITLPLKHRRALTWSIAGACIIVLATLAVAVASNRFPSMITRATPPSTRVGASIQTTASPQTTSTPQATSAPEPTVMPSSPAQQMAHLVLGRPVKASNILVQTFVAEMSQMQPICQLHQFQVANLIIATWRRIKAEGGKTSLPTVAQTLEGAVGMRVAPPGPAGCRGLADQFVRDESPAAPARQTATASPVRPQMLTPTVTPTPDLLATWGPDTYNKVTDHPDLYHGAIEVWTCVIAKFLGDDQNNPGNSLIGCWEYKGSYDGLTGDGEVILSVPSAIDTNSMDSGDYVRVEGKVDHPIQGTNGYGATETWPQLDVLAIEDDGPNSTGSTT